MNNAASTRSVVVLTLMLVMLALPFGIAALRFRLTGLRPRRSYGAHLMFLCTITLGPGMVSGNSPSLIDLVRTVGFTVAIWGVAVALSEWFDGRLPHGSRRV